MIEKLLLILTALGFAGFIFGLAGKSAAIKGKSILKSEIFQKVTYLSLIVMLASAVLYALI